LTWKSCVLPDYCCGLPHWRCHPGLWTRLSSPYCKHGSTNWLTDGELMSKSLYMWAVCLSFYSSALPTAQQHTCLKRTTMSNRILILMKLWSNYWTYQTYWNRSVKNNLLSWLGILFAGNTLIPMRNWNYSLLFYCCLSSLTWHQGIIPEAKNFALGDSPDTLIDLVGARPQVTCSTQWHVLKDNFNLL